MSLPQSIPLPGLVRCLHPDKSGTDMHRRGSVCGYCFQDALVPVEAKAKAKNTIPLPKSKPGSILEAATLLALTEAGYVRDLDFICQYHFADERNFAADFGFPKQRVLAECIGQAHSISGKRDVDCERESIAASRGWRIVKATKATVEDGRFIGWLKQALEYRSIP
jgi:very-short-patch-repair endonuclease